MCKPTNSGAIGVHRWQVPNQHGEVGKVIGKVGAKVVGRVLNRVLEVTLPGHTGCKTRTPQRPTNPAAMPISRRCTVFLAAIHVAILCKHKAWFSTIAPMTERPCSKPACSNAAMATLSFDYQLSTAVLGMLSPRPEPGCYDLCLEHQRKFLPPQGWQLIRHQHLTGMEKGQK